MRRTHYYGKPVVKPAGALLYGKLLVKWFTAVILLTPLTAIGQITLDQQSGYTTGAQTSGDHTFASFAVANHTNRLLLDFIGFNGAVETDITGATFNGDAMTKNTGASIYQSTAAGLVTFYRVAPDVATGSIVATTNNADYIAQNGISLYGVNQSTPFRDQDEEGGTTSTSTADLTLTTVAGDWVISCLYVHNGTGGTLTPDSGTATTTIQPVSGLRQRCSYQTAVGATTTVGWSGWSGNDGWAHVAVAIAPAQSIIPLLKYYQDLK